MASLWAALRNAVLPPGGSGAAAAPPCSYEDVHAQAQSVLLPPAYPKGVSVYALKSVNKNFALQYR
jgi:hypothetical protein